MLLEDPGNIESKCAVPELLLKVKAINLNTPEGKSLGQK